MQRGLTARLFFSATGDGISYRDIRLKAKTFRDGLNRSRSVILVGMGEVEKPPVATRRHGSIPSRGTVLVKSVWSLGYGSHGPTGDREGRATKVFSEGIVTPTWEEECNRIDRRSRAFADHPRHYLRW